MGLYDKVRELCEEQGRSIASVERAARLGAGTIRKWNTRSPRVSSLARVAEALGKPADEMILMAIIKENHLEGKIKL